MGIAEILIILAVSLVAGVGTVEYQHAREEPKPLVSPAVPSADAPVFNGIKINGKDARV